MLITVLALFGERRDRLQELVEPEWLLEHVRGAFLHRDDRIRHGCVSRHHDHFARRQERWHLSHELHAVAVGQHQIAHHDIETALTQKARCTRATRCRSHRVAFASQSFTQTA
jgi:hypothetical protein